MEKALAIAIITDEIKKDGWQAEDILAELNELIRSARVKPEAGLTCGLRGYSPSLFLGKGKIEEIRGIAEGSEADVVVFSENLSGTQQKNIEDMLGVKTIDRTQLILDIFAGRAKSAEGKIQVELAQLEYLLPRLSGKGVALSRLGGGIGTRGPGEQKLEVDRRRVRARIGKLKKSLDTVTGQRSMRRRKRERFSVLTVALIGYTNAGKSTLLNRLTGSNARADSRLFATLDPAVRRCRLPNNQSILFADTVGFIYRLPHGLIESFKATLEEAVDADLLLNVLDMSHPKVKEHNEATYRVLKELGIERKPVITVLNKLDKAGDPVANKRLIKDFKGAVAVSALRGNNINCIVDRIAAVSGDLMAQVKIEMRAGDMKLLHDIYKLGKITKRIDRPSGIYIEAQVPRRLADKLSSKPSGI